MGVQRLESEYGRPALEVDGLVPTVMLRHHLGRVHIGTSRMDVLRDVRAALKRVGDDPQWTRERKRQTLQAALWLHEENRAEYRWVMGGMQ